jgi:hypothetical protein
MALPSQCPKCGAMSISVSKVPPDKHDHGSEWATKVECEDCDEFVRWRA